MTTSIVKRYYDGLAEKKLLATKCASCAKLTFPPTTACEHCGSFELEWVELGGHGKALYVSHGIAPPPNPRFAEIAPFAYGHVELDEGVFVQGMITNVEITPDALMRVFEEGPVDVEPDIVEVEGLPILAFRRV